jgi:hypothetical protein
MQMKRTSTLDLAVLVIGIAFVGQSAPLWNHPQRLVQPDGSVVHCFASGDEFNHYHEASYGQLATTATFYPIATNSVLSFQDVQV